jgi:hypothetical protein
MHVHGGLTLEFQSVISLKVVQKDDDSLMPRIYLNIITLSQKALSFFFLIIVEIPFCFVRSTNIDNAAV